MDTASLHNIAWLIPSAGNRWAFQATRIPANSARRVNLAPLVTRANLDSIPEDPEEDFLSEKENENENETCVSPMFPRVGLGISFDHKPKGSRGFVIGTDPHTCDIVLPRVRGISRRHCYLTFDSDKRLILRDTSKHGTAVWYDGHSNGDQRRATWVLSSGMSYGFPAMVNKIVIDIQGVRFQIVVNECLPHLEEYQDLVDDFLSSIAAASVAASFAPSRPSLVPAPLRIQRPVFVKYTIPSDDGTQSDYLWNAAKPWEPLVKVAS
ncbi:hypothetical protein SODALDRAFT_331452 [Sodiomyces alkalinus F11]|uniref:FHA domain-containing protein n=1 Tax=Sodiomyces alkalinus (strain CBS 110278 / VKM F-3762 / F11) TaxID=1314773 RepID=A0A3N2Q4I6_SODAK|nr:hypothetical protein SODALDRAFT_331452 [Sodiomyces alkalinus F11]ROT41681.1 hypothetical protein SODALDRAFT_331452 [Sodiomyces alkalinus F11]